MVRKDRKPIISVTIEDCEVQTFRAGGKGGQHQNKTETGVRITHKQSGAVGEARDSRSQVDNKRAAFKRMADSTKFQNWLRLEVARIQSGKTVEELVDEMVQEKYLRVEFRDRTGTTWVDEPVDNTTAIKFTKEGTYNVELGEQSESD
jgi:protein subunit release factor B